MRIGFAGLTHGHVWGLIDRFSEVEGVELVAVSDHTPLLAKAMPKFQHGHGDWQHMLDKEQIDALVVCSDNRESSQIATRALAMGIPCLVEKAMAADGHDAMRMLEAKKHSGKTLMINWPTAWAAWPYELKKQIEDPAIGKAFHFRYRNGHYGPKEIGCDEYFVGWLYDEHKNGGGSLADFGGYGAVLARWYFGNPDSVFCARGNYTKPPHEVPDDHAIVVLKYPKMDCVLEATWATFGFDDSANPVVHATKGTLGVYGDKIKKFVSGKDPETIALAPLENTSPAKYFIDCIQNEVEPLGILNAEISADAARIIEAAVKSSRSGCAERLEMS